MKSLNLQSRAKCATARVVRLWILGLAVAGALTTLPAATPAAAHGERSQQAFLRMRTLNWYDVKWSNWAQ
jgi:methane/ammonia monooxygenase subunit B